MPISERKPGLTRREATVALVAAGLTLTLPRRAGASAVSRAQQLVASISGDVTGLINSGRSETQLYREFERILARYGDMPAVAASVLGPPWRSATPGQRSAFVSAFQTYLARKYGRQFNEYRNAQIRLTGARDAGRAGVLVNTTVVRPGQQNIAVDWQISERSGSPKAVNLIIEGVSMLANERAEVGAMLEAQGGSVDRLITQMQGRA